MDSLKLQSRHDSFKMTEKRSGHDQLMELQTSDYHCSSNSQESQAKEKVELTVTCRWIIPNSSTQRSKFITISENDFGAHPSSSR